MKKSRSFIKYLIFFVFTFCFISNAGILKGAVDSELSMIFDPDFAKSAVTAISSTSTSPDSGVMNLITKVSSTAAMPIGTTLLAIYFVMNIMEMMTAGNFTSDHFIRALIKLAFGEFVISNATYFVILFCSVGADFMASIMDASKLAGVVYSATLNRTTGLGAELTYLIALLVPMGLMQIIKILVQVVGAARTLEIIVRAMAAPIGTSDIMNGMNSNGVKYLKACLGLCIQGGLMIAVIMAAQALLGSMITATLSGGTFSVIAAICGVYGAMAFMLFSTKSLSKELIGA